VWATSTHLENQGLGCISECYIIWKLVVIVRFGTKVWNDEVVFVLRKKLIE
jgi:hypothetical protein